MTFPTLETERLQLIEITEVHAKNIYEFFFKGGGHSILWNGPDGRDRGG